MRIRHLVCTDNFAGVERYVATTSVELARRGHTVEVFGGDPDAMRAAIGDGAVTFVDAPGPRGAIRASWRRSRPDVVHSHMTAADLVAVATRPAVRAPVVSTLHFAQPRGHDGLTRRVYSVLPHLVTAQVAISRFVADHAGSRARIIPNGVPAPPTDVGPERREPVVLVAQRLESEKDTSTALRAFAGSQLADDGWTLRIAGRGSEAGALERLARTLGVADRVEFLGHVDDIADRIAHSALLLATAPGEPFGLSVVEAMAAGLPVIAAEGGAHRETIGSATPETLFPPGDAAAAADLLRRYADDPAARADLGARGRARHVEAFSIEAHVDALESLYDEVAGRRSPGHR